MSQNIMNTLVALAPFPFFANFEKITYLHTHPLPRLLFSKGDRNYGPRPEHSTKQDNVTVKLFLKNRYINCSLSQSNTYTKIHLINYHYNIHYISVNKTGSQFFGILLLFYQP